MRRFGVLVGLLAASALIAPALIAPAPAGATATDHGLALEVVSSPRATFVTGGSALVRLRWRDPLRTDQVSVFAGSRDVTGAFVAQPDGTLLGLVTGLPDGASVLVASVRRTRHGPPLRWAVLRVVNHPITGPVFSGPQQVPFFCETTAFGLAPATPPLCAAPTVVSYQYRTTAGRFAPLADPTAQPADLAQANVDGRPVPYIVRIERGTIDRAVYEMAALWDGGDPSPTRANAAWNRRLVYTFGGGCNVGYHQGAGTGGVVNDLFLGRGYAVASSSLNVLDNNCSYVISAEVAMMVKEHFVEAYGPPAHTIGWGGSGGAIQQYDIADNYPGILSGIVPQVSFPDAVTTGMTVGDCRLLNRYFSASTLGYTDTQKNAVSGYGSWGSCVNWDLAFASRGNATEACPTAIPPEFLYNPVTNPGGIKCTTAEQLVTQLGRDPATGFARGYADNVGVQYGLAALRAGQITPEQFVDLNEKVGGYDVAGNVVGARNSADPLALVRSYRSGIVLSASAGLATTPVIDLRAYTDAINDIHTRFWSFTERQRLVDAFGPSGALGQAILVAPITAIAANPQAFALDAMDRWLTALAADRRPGSDRSRMLRNRPADLGDGCWTPAGERVVEFATWQGAGTCNTLYPSFGDTRIAAGAPLRENVLKCQRKPFDFRGTAFTPEQRDRLRAVFPDGVCDYSKPGVGLRGVAGVWQTY